MFRPNFDSLKQIDEFALGYARNHPVHRIRCDNTIDQLFNEPNPSTSDLIPIFHLANGETEQITITQLGTLIGGGGGGTISQSTPFPGLLYNYGYYVSVAAGSGQVRNSNAMTNMTSAMGTASAVGGWAWIPEVAYNINFVAGGYPVPYDSWIIGLGGGGTGNPNNGAPAFYHFTAPGDGLLFSCSGPHTSGGAYFQGLAMQAGSPTLTNTCAIYAGYWNARAMKCNFVSWPIAYFANVLSAGMEQCTLQYGGPSATSTAFASVTVGAATQLMPNVTTPGGPSAPNGIPVYGSGGSATNPGNGTSPVMFILGAVQTYAIGPGEYFQNPTRDKGGATNVIGIGVGGVGGGGSSLWSGSPGPVEHGVVRDIHVTGFGFAISYVFNAGTVAISGDTGLAGAFAADRGTKGCYFSGMETDAWSSCLIMMLAGQNAAIFGDRFVNCMFQKAAKSTDGSAIIYIDATTYANNGAPGQIGGSPNNHYAINDIEFNGCTVFNNVSVAPTASTYGVNLVSCSNVKFFGGTIANMGTAINGSANVALSNVPGTTTCDVQNCLFSGVNMQQTYQQGNHNPSQYALIVASNPGGPVTFDTCSMTGFGTGIGQVSVTGNTVTNLFIRNCPGYNDQNASILNGVTNLPVTGTNACSSNGAAVVPGGVNYYGPSIVMFTATSAGVNFKCKGFVVAVPANGAYSVWLDSPNDNISFDNASHVATFTWIGM